MMLLVTIGQESAAQTFPISLSIIEGRKMLDVGVKVEGPTHSPSAPGGQQW